MDEQEVQEKETTDDAAPEEDASSSLEEAWRQSTEHQDREVEKKPEDADQETKDDADEEVEKKDDEPSYLDDEAMDTRIRFKENGEDRDISVKELIGKAQKGYLYDRKHQELASMRRDLEAKQEPQKSVEQEKPAQDAHVEEAQKYVQVVQDHLAGHIKEHPEMQGLAEVVFHQAQVIADLHQRMQGQSEWRDKLEARQTEDKALDAVMGGIEKLQESYGLSREEAVSEWEEGYSQGIVDPIAYYRHKNFDEIIQREREKSLEEGSKTAKKNSKASISAKNASRDGKGQFKDNVDLTDRGAVAGGMLDMLNKRGV